MNSNTLPYLATALIAGSLVSCSDAPSDDQPPVEVAPKIEETVKLPAVDDDPLKDWRVPTGDTQLPTAAQLADGSESSIGIQNQGGATETSPGASIKPPITEPEDQLAPPAALPYSE